MEGIIGQSNVYTKRQRGRERRREEKEREGEGGTDRQTVRQRMSHV